MGIAETMYWSEYERVEAMWDRRRPPKPRSVLIDEAEREAQAALAERDRELDQVAAAARYLAVLRECHPDLVQHLEMPNSKWRVVAGGRMPELRPAGVRWTVAIVRDGGMETEIEAIGKNCEHRLAKAAAAEAAARAMPEDSAAEAEYDGWRREAGRALDKIEYPGEENGR